METVAKHLKIFQIFFLFQPETREYVETPQASESEYPQNLSPYEQETEYNSSYVQQSEDYIKQDSPIPSTSQHFHQMEPVDPSNMVFLSSNIGEAVPAEIMTNNEQYEGLLIKNSTRSCDPKR